MRTGWPESGHPASVLLQTVVLSCAIPIGLGRVWGGLPGAPQSPLGCERGWLLMPGSDGDGSISPGVCPQNGSLTSLASAVTCFILSPH